MSFSTTEVKDVPVGTYVKVVATKNEMRNSNSYNAEMDRGDVGKVANHHFAGRAFQLEGNNGSGPYMKPTFVEVVTGSNFDSDIDLVGDELICTETDTSYWTVGTTYTVTEGERCGCGCQDDEDMLGLEDDDGDHDSNPNSDVLFINITRIKREMTEPSVTTAVAVVELAPPVPVPTPIVNFGDLSDEDKAELLLAKHEGKPLQMYSKWIKRWQFVEDAKWTESLAYRVEPSEITEARVKVDEVSKGYTDALDKLFELNKAA